MKAILEITYEIKSDNQLVAGWELRGCESLSDAEFLGLLATAFTEMQKGARKGKMPRKGFSE